MASKLVIKGKQLTGAVANALKINCKDKDGKKSTVQAELNKLNNEVSEQNKKLSWKFIGGDNGNREISLAEYEHISSEFMFVVSYPNSDNNVLEIVSIIVPHNEVFNIDRDVRFFSGGGYGGTLGIGASVLISKANKTAQVIDFYFNALKGANEVWINVYYH